MDASIISISSTLSADKAEIITIVPSSSFSQQTEIENVTNFHGSGNWSQYTNSQNIQAWLAGIAQDIKSATRNNDLSVSLPNGRDFSEWNKENSGDAEYCFSPKAKYARRDFSPDTEAFHLTSTSANNASTYNRGNKKNWLVDSACIPDSSNTVNNLSNYISIPQSTGGSNGWKCTKCYRTNLGNRCDCYNCSASKLNSSDVIGGGDWNCLCGYSNFISRAYCRKCHKYPTCITDELGPNLCGNEKIKVDGVNIPQPFDRIEDCRLNSELFDVLFHKMGLRNLTPIQRYAIPILLANRDAIIKSPTGTGKTLMYLLPILDGILKRGQVETITSGEILKPIAIILAPTNDLANQIGRNVQHLANGTFVKSRVLGDPVNVNRTQSDCHIIIATPYRLIAHQPMISFANIRNIVLDEADIMIENPFKENIQTFLLHSSMAPVNNRNLVMVSATMPYEKMLLAKAYMVKPICVMMGVSGAACSEIRQTFLIEQVCQDDFDVKMEKLLRMLTISDPSGTLIFVQTREQADFLAIRLNQERIVSISVHGGHSELDRSIHWKEFRRDERKIMVATDLAARGLDLRNVKHVINFVLPTNIETYIHRIGRCARLGNNGTSTSFVNLKTDFKLVHDLVNCLRHSNQTVPDILQSYCTNLG